MRRCALLLLAAACSLPPPEQAKVWAAETMFPEQSRDFAGFPTSRLGVKAGQPVPYRTAEYGGSGETFTSNALVVQPAYFEGAPSAYVITEIWENHPDPWVQPVYHFVTLWDPVNPGAHRAGKDGVFGVGTDSTFYSPFWRLQWVESGDAGGTFKEVREITQFPMHRGPMVVCPIVPDGVRLAGDTHPFTGEPLRSINIGLAYANGQRVEYFDFGANRQVANTYEGESDGTVSADDLYVFARFEPDGTRTVLELPAVLPTGAADHAYLRRVDVVLTGEAVFVPANLTALRARLKQQVNVPDADPLIPEAVARQYLMRVAVDGSCFASAATFPGGCEWLDSEDALEEHVAASRIFETDVTLTATAVLRP